MGGFTITLQPGATCIYNVFRDSELVGTANEVDGTWTLINLLGRKITRMQRMPDQRDLEELED